MCKSPVSLIDLYPTLLELCGLPENKLLDGRSFAPLVQDPEADWPYPALITHSPHWHGTNHAIRSRDFHYIHYSDGGEELYDNNADPHQWKNLADDARFEATKAELKKWLPKTNAPHYRGDKSASSGTRQEFRQSDAATTQRVAPALQSQDRKTQGNEGEGRGQKPKVLTTSATANSGKTAPATVTSSKTNSAKTSEKRPNVIILLADDLGSKDLGCYGGPVKTPVLDELAAKGVRFTDFHAGAAVCSTSRATLLTGRQHLRTGIYGVLQDHWHNMHLLEREVTIPEILQQSGYGTAHFGKWHIGMTSGKRKKPSPTEHGFDYWFGLSNGAHPSHKDPVNFLRNGERVGPLKGYSCQLIVDDAIQWLDKRNNSEEPFFLNLWFNEPHHKLAAPDEIVSIYGDLEDEAAIYSATVDNSDRAIGRLVAKLKAMGELDNTLIIYSSDHGSYRADRNGGLNGNKGSNFQGGLRSPGIFFWPDGIRGGRLEDTASGSVDLLPTICSLVGIDSPEGVHLDGADLTPLLTEKGKFQREQPLLWLAPSSGHLATMRDGDYTLMGYRGYQLPFDRDQYNDIVRRMAELAGIDPTLPNLGQRVSNTTFSNPEFNRLNFERVRLQTFQEAWVPAIKAGGFGRFALYDLSTDPLQQKDISKQRPQVTERLKKKLLELYQDVMKDAPHWEPVEGVYSTATPPRSGTRQELRPGPESPKTSDNSSAGDILQNAKLLALTDLLDRIEKTGIPNGYDVGNHQPWVDRRMESLTPKQRQRVGELWQEKRRLQPKMNNVGMSFVRILEYVAGEENLIAAPDRKRVKDEERNNAKEQLEEDAESLDDFRYQNNDAKSLDEDSNKSSDAENLDEDGNKNMEKTTRIHRLSSTKRSLFDAFSYVNRLPEPFEEELPQDFSSRVFSRLANQEGRIQIKTPPDMEVSAYEGFKTFLRFEGEDSVGNCSACHSLPDFRDGKSHTVTKNSGAALTPSLRNIGTREVKLGQALKKKIVAARQKTSGEADSISDEYSSMNLNDNDMFNLIAFLKLLEDVSDERFREMIIKASVLDTTSAPK
ncbi:MAG: sulfatase-like hydrolase/transferase [Planctomycetota bacterium]